MSQLVQLGIEVGDDAFDPLLDFSILLFLSIFSCDLKYYWNILVVRVSYRQIVHLVVSIVEWIEGAREDGDIFKRRVHKHGRQQNRLILSKINILNSMFNSYKGRVRVFKVNILLIYLV